MERDRLDDVGAEAMERNRSVVAGGERGEPSGAAVRRPHITDALAQTFFEEWARVGYSALSLEAVAKKAGVGKAALYRRWRCKADMARDLISQVGAGIPAGLDTGDRGSLEEDLVAAILTGSRMMRHPLVRRIMPDLYAAIPREPALAAAMRPADAAWERKVAALIERAIGRGELRPDLDRGLAAAVLIGPMYWRLVILGKRFTSQDVRAAARLTAAALKAA